jgi:hypothetical protein
LGASTQNDPTRFVVWWMLVSHGRRLRRHREGSHTFSVTDRHATLDDALTEFDDSLHGGEILDAVILTQSSKRNERPVGTMTAADQPGLRSMTRA